MKEYIVLDLEWNQSPGGKEESVEGLPFEIIEIGAVKLDLEFKAVSEFHRLIKPRVYQQIHFKISEVTHMDMEELKNEGGDFQEVMEEFIDWCGGDYEFCTWGSMDLTELQRNMAYYEIPNPFAKPLLYYDIQKLYCLLFGDGKMKPSLDLAVGELDLMEERPFHRALDDAYYTGRVMAEMGFALVSDYESIDYFRIPNDKSEEIYMEFPSYSKYVSRAFPTKEEAIADKAVTDMLCCSCHRMLRKKIRWFSSNQKFYFALAYCPEHGYLKGKIRMKRTDEGLIYVVKTLKLVGDEGAELIFEKREEMRKRRNEKSRVRRRSKSDDKQGEERFT